MSQEFWNHNKHVQLVEPWSRDGKPAHCLTIFKGQYVQQQASV